MVRLCVAALRTDTSYTKKNIWLKLEKDCFKNGNEKAFSAERHNVCLYFHTLCNGGLRGDTMTVPELKVCASSLSALSQYSLPSDIS